MEPINYIKRIIPKHETVEAMYVDDESYQAVALWMGYNDIRHHDAGWLLKKKGGTYVLHRNTYIVDKVQTMQPDEFRKTYKLWPKDLL